MFNTIVVPLQMTLFLCSMPAVDHTSEHKLRQRSTKPCRERPAVPGSVPW